MSKHRLCTQTTHILILALPLTRCVTLDVIPNLSVLLFLTYLEKDTAIIATTLQVARWSWGKRELTAVISFDF